MIVRLCGNVRLSLSKPCEECQAELVEAPSSLTPFDKLRVTVCSVRLSLSKPFDKLRATTNKKPRHFSVAGEPLMATTETLLLNAIRLLKSFLNNSFQTTDNYFYH
jgi:hypothetical protein